MKRILDQFFSRYPSLYLFVLRGMRSTNTEKMTLLRLIKDGDVVLDVGANRGDFTVLFSHVVGRRGSIHAFEPVPPTFSLLSGRVAQECRAGNVVLNPFGLGETRGKFEMQVPAGDFAQASLRTHEAGSWSKSGRQTFQCEVRTLDEYVREKGLDHLDFVKLDVEGAELPALRGAQGCLAQFRPTIQLEFCAPWTKAFGYGAAELVIFLQALGYVYFYDNALALLQAPVREMEAVEESQNIVCSARPLHAARAA